MSFIKAAKRIRHINEGGMAVVEEYEHPIMGPVAVKFLKATPSADESDLFFTEAVRMIGLRHQHIVKVYKALYFEDEFNHSFQRPGIIMQLINGPTLENRLRQGPIPWKSQDGVGGEMVYLAQNVYLIADQVLQALEFAHHGNPKDPILHLDIKPSNIMISWEFDENKDQEINVIRVLDFGISQCQNSDSFFRGGTSDYMAPEQYAEYPKHIQYQVGTDLFALALTLYELLAGELPWSMDTSYAEVYQIKMSGAIPNICTVNPNVPKHVGVVLEKALNPDISKRYNSAIQMAKDLQLGDSPSQIALIDIHPSDDLNRRNFLLSMLGVLLMIVSLVLWNQNF